MAVKLAAYERIDEGDAYCRSSGEVVFNSVTGGSAARGNPDLAIDRGQVGVDGARADDQVFGHLLIRQPLRHQAQYLHFSGGQSGRISGSGLRWRS